MYLLQKIISLFTSFVMLFTATTVVGFIPKQDEILLNVSIISDTHLDSSLPLGQTLLADGLDDMSNSETPVDAVVVAGDLTNYGDDESLHAFYDIFNEHCLCENWVIAAGNHDIGHVEDITHEEARQRLINYYNEYTGSDTENIYYTKTVNGYTFIVLSDQSDDSWDHPDLYEDQLTFLDEELAKATADGLPAFVICHWPLEGGNGQDVVWEEGGIGEEYSDTVQAILEKYDNVFFISGHLHEGINGEVTEEVLGFSSVEQTVSGVTYVNLPTYTLVNRYGVPWGGLGFQFEVYSDKVIIRARDYVTSQWYDSYEYTVPIR